MCLLTTSMCMNHIKGDLGLYAAFMGISGTSYDIVCVCVCVCVCVFTSCSMFTILSFAIYLYSFRVGIHVRHHASLQPSCFDLAVDGSETPGDH